MNLQQVTEAASATHDVFRRHIPSDIQPIVGRSEVWRSLKTDSLQGALRRFPLVAAALESEFERIRHDAGLSVDQTLLKPCEGDLVRSLNKQESSQPESDIGATVTLGEAYARYIEEAPSFKPGFADGLEK